MTRASVVARVAAPNDITDRLNLILVGSKTMQHLNEALARERMREMQHRSREVSPAHEQMQWSLRRRHRVTLHTRADRSRAQSG